MNLSRVKIIAPWVVATVYIVTFIAYGHNERLAGFAEADAKGHKALAELRLEYVHLEAEQAQAAERRAIETAKRIQVEHTRSAQLGAKLAEQQRQHRQITERLSGEVARVNALYRESLDSPPKPVPACVFSSGWVRVYDEATGARVPTPVDSAGVAASAASSTAADQLNSGISQTQLLEHHLQYAEQCRNTAAQLNRLIDQVIGK